MHKTIKILKELPEAVKASIAFFVASIVTKGIAYFTTPFYTRLLTPQEYGQTSVFLTWQSILGIIAMFSLQAGVFNNGMIDYPHKRDDYSFSMLILSNVITIGFSIVLFGSYPLIKNWLHMDFPFVVLMCCVFFFQPAYNFWFSRQRYELKYKKTVIWIVASAFLSSLVAIILLTATDIDHLYSRIFGAEGVLIVFYFGFYIYLGKQNKWKLNTTYWKAAVLFNFPLIPHYLSTYLLGSSDKLMISYLVDDAATAYYSVAYSIAAVATIVWSAVNGSLIPYTYENCKIKNYKAISDITLPILVVFACACGVVIFFAPEVVALMATKAYMEAIYVIPPIVGGVFFQVQYYIYANVVYYFKKPAFIMLASATATFLNLLLNYLFIPKFGYVAAGYTTLFCYIIQALIDYFAMKKVVGESVYNMRFIVALSVIVIFVALISGRFYGNVLIRYGIILLFFCFVLVKHKKLIEILKKKTDISRKEKIE